MASEESETSNLSRDYFEFRKLLSLRNEPVMHLLCGSFFELPLLYFFSNPTDMDVMFCDMTFCVTYSHDNVPARRLTNVLKIDLADCHVGFVKLRNGEKKEPFKKPYDFGEGPTAISRLPLQDTDIRNLLGKVFPRWKDIDMLTYDNVYALFCPQWPKDVFEWITRKRVNDWPSEETINNIVKGGFHLVSKPHAKNPPKDAETQWRYSFSQAETILIHDSWTDVQKYIYHLLRIIKREVVRKCGIEKKTFLTNYYIKTLMLWACERKTSEFWKDRNIVKSVRELLLELIEILRKRNHPHYFMPENNIMDDLPCDLDFNSEIRSLLYYAEEENEEAILGIVRNETKAYKINSEFILVPNQSLYPLLARLSNILHTSRNKIVDEQLQNSRIDRICSSNYFYPELEHLHKGVMMHLQFLKLLKYDYQEHLQDCITSAEHLFDMSIQKLDTGFTGIRLHLGWSFIETYQLLWLFCGGEHVQDQSLAEFSCLCASRMAHALRYISDNSDYSKEPLETKDFSIFQVIIPIGLTLSFNVTYFVCAAYRSNFYFNALSDYRKERKGKETRHLRRALDLCKEAKRQLNELSLIQEHMFTELLPFPLKNEWSELYDEHIQVVLGYLTLCRALTTSPAARNRVNPFYLCSVQYLKYIYTRCCRVLGEPIGDFGFNYGLCTDKISPLRYQVDFSKVILQTVLYITERQKSSE